MTQGNYPPGAPHGGFPGFPGIPNQQPPQAAPAPAPGYGPPPQQPGYGPPPQAPPYPGHAPQGYPPPAPAAYPPAQSPQGYPGQGYPPPQGHGPPQGYGQPHGQGRPAGGFQQPSRSRNFSGADMQGLKPAGVRYPFMQCIDQFRPSTWILEVVKTEQTEMSGSFCVEFKVHWTDAPNVEPGAMRTWIQTFNKGKNGFETGLRAVKRFTLSAIGCDTEEQALAGGQNLDELYSAIGDSQNHLTHPATGQPLVYGPNPLKGRMLTCVVNPPNPPSPFQRHDFSPRVG